MEIESFREWIKCFRLEWFANLFKPWSVDAVRDGTGNDFEQIFFESIFKYNFHTYNKPRHLPIPDWEYWWFIDTVSEDCLGGLWFSPTGSFSSTLFF